MAAEVPVYDILSEAMEYLTKLGSNLRTRSENLKEKRISKHNLRNSHALQKAATKVLLICELSKKSIDNVESGVRRVLSFHEASQAPLGGKDSDIINGSRCQYHYFEYQSHKLRIAKKISLKHYMSVKVLAKAMSTSTLNNYPVYYDCKLKWERQKVKAKFSRKHDIIDSGDDQCEISGDNLHTQVPDLNQCSPRPIDDCQDAKSDIEQKNMANNSGSETEPSIEKNFEKSNSDVSSKIVGTEDCNLHNNKNTEYEKSRGEKIEYSKAEVDKIKKNPNKIRVADVFSSDSDEDKSNFEKAKEDCESDNCNHEPKSKKLKSNMPDNVACQLNSDAAEISEELLPNTDSNYNDTSKICESTQNESGEHSKPFLKCINLSKLLKPDIDSNNSMSVNTEHSKFKKSKLAGSKTKQHLLKKDMKVQKPVQNEIDEIFWALKRKEASEFKSKEFSVRIERLPNLSLSFLVSHKLKRITKQGNTICEISNEIDTPNSKQIKAVKHALLNDSESDECTEIGNTITEKRLMLKDSDPSIDKDEIKVTDREKGDENKIEDEEVLNQGAKNNSAKKHDETDREDKSDSDKSNESQEDETFRSNSLDDKVKESQNHTDNKQCNVELNDIESVTKNILAVKSSLLNDSSDDDTSKNDNSPETVVDQMNSDNHECNIQSTENELSTPTKNDEVIKPSCSNNIVDDGELYKQDVETPTKTNEKIKSSLLKDSSDENSNKNEEESPTKVNQKIKSALLNDSSDVQTDKSVNQTDKQKSPRSKKKLSRKCREKTRQKLKYPSSSDSEKEKPKRKTRRKMSHFSSTSSSDDKKKKIKKKKQLKTDSDSNGSHNQLGIGQVDGALDEHSNSSVAKMVRSKVKPSGSSSHNSDNQDASDKDIDGLTNLNNLNKTRRRDTSAKSNNPDKKSSNQSKPTPIIGEDLLKSESSSDASDVAEDALPDLPEIKVSGLNGDHMAKDDLLGESDSSLSHNDKDQSENADNSDEEKNVKSKRRKANAISSDSDGVSNRRKNKEDKMSDFEDSEEESSEAGKKAKRKKKPIDSDASNDSTDGGLKKRRRIKVVNDSDGSGSGSGSDTENEGRNKHGRKNIRKVMGKNQLEEATKKAAREEKERIARITERQKMYNNLDFDESGKPDEVVLDKVVLDFDPETKEPLIQVDTGLVKKLKPHQANGIKFMWDACFESVKRIKKDKGSGCILAHCMGLGKTLQVISLTHTLLIHGKLTGVNRVLVVCPLSTVLNWVNEFRMWLKHAVTEFEVDVYELSRYKQNSERAFQLQQWFEGGGVCVLGYEMFRNLSADNNKKFKKKILKSFQESLVEPGPDLVVCDEGHLLKNEKTSLSQSMNKVKTLRRIVLTGTPLQNNLKEYYCMVQFVKPNLLGKYNEYLNRFVNPITNGQYTDSTEHDIRVMKRRSHVLHKMLDGAVQRRDYGVLAPFLPPKHEFVLFITLTEVQIKLYQFYLDNYSRRPLPGKSSGFLFPDFQSLQRIWTHPLVLKYNSERYEIMQQKKRDREEEDSEGSLVDFIDDDSTPDESSTESSSDDLSDVSDDSRKKSKKKKSSKKGKGKDKDSKSSTRRGTRANPDNPAEVEEEEIGGDDVIEVKNENPTEWWIKLVEESELEDMRNSHKLVLLFDILRQCEAIGDKLLVFSQSLYSLDLIEHFLGKVDEATQEGRIDEKLGGHVGSWSPGVDYFRLDGSTSCENRSIWCKNFNREDNPRARLFLISTRAGGLGINLVAANRVVIFDVSWNPSHDVQSIFRVYRFGQKKPCYVYRFLAMGTMEEKIYERQVTKQAISKRVIDEQQIDRHYAENDLAELYKFEAMPSEPRPLPTLPKDRLFAEMLKEHEAQIYKYHEHDSLLENKEEETLSEEERKAAWEDFENEKTRPPPAPFPSAWPMHNGMMPGLLAQQQQQLAYAALAAMLRKDMPNINDNQIRDMLPLICNANPGLMQKMGDIYKYAQPGMMNPAMMNPMMNAGGGGAAVGGASGLQYEPPWQRQHQQQQQMRLQQLMQQQNQMGPKIYAGGLGSRDPIAMALQQQRAREMLMGGGGTGGGGAAGGAGRPRGRPPLQPRHPTSTSQDVVNLDSD